MPQGIRPTHAFNFLSTIRDADDAALLSMARTAFMELARRRKLHVYDSENCTGRDDCMGLHWGQLCASIIPGEMVPYASERDPLSKAVRLLKTESGYAWELLIGQKIENRRRRQEASSDVAV